jgi:hypothetical protein
MTISDFVLPIFQDKTKKITDIMVLVVIDPCGPSQEGVDMRGRWGIDPRESKAVS